MNGSSKTEDCGEDINQMVFNIDATNFGINLTALIYVLAIYVASLHSKTQVRNKLNFVPHYLAIGQSLISCVDSVTNIYAAEILKINMCDTHTVNYRFSSAMNYASGLLMCFGIFFLVLGYILITRLLQY